LVTMGGLEEGDRVLVHAAAGGVGIAATQIAKLRGAEVFGTASASKHDAIREQGVDHAIDYRNLDYAEEVMRITGGEGVDVILDALGPTSARKGYKILRPGGCLIVYGASEVSTGETRNLLAVGRAVLTAPFATIPWWKSVGIINENKGVFGLNMLHWLDTEGSLDRVIRPLMAELEKGSIRPVVSEVFRFDQAADAHRFIGERRNVGKVVLVP
jgi:synaptic vesicle membrane protein VAT-1